MQNRTSCRQRPVHRPARGQTGTAEKHVIATLRCRQCHLLHEAAQVLLARCGLPACQQQHAQTQAGKAAQQCGAGVQRRYDFSIQRGVRFAGTAGLGPATCAFCWQSAVLRQAGHVTFGWCAFCLININIRLFTNKDISYIHVSLSGSCK
jgi:hypothetical protein